MGEASGSAGRRRQRSSPAGRRLGAVFLAVCAVTIATTVLAVAAAQPAVTASPATTFRGFIDSFRIDAERHGIGGAFYDATFAGMTSDPTVAGMIGRQPEFARPLGAYLATQVTPDRIATGRSMLRRWGTELAAIEQRSGVPASIVVAVWGLETGFGVAAGGKDVIRSLATLAAMNYRPDLYRTELIAALTMLQSGEVSRENLRGSWAGAMGQPQFMPSSFAKYAVDFDGDGRRDIWTSVPDALASIANFLAKQGWQAGRPWGFEVALPAALDIGDSRATAPVWASRGVARIDGAALPASGDFTLFFPAGAKGPAFLVTPNYEVLKTYNFSDAYVLSIASLADRIDGGPAFAGAWPGTPPMARDARIALQAQLVALGYTVDNREGRISLALRDTIRRAQASVHMTPDGNPTDALLTALGHARGAP